MAERLEKPSTGVLPQSTQSGKTYKTSDPRVHLVEMDALRGLAILGVVVPHIILNFPNHLHVPLSNVELVDLFLSAWGPFCLALFFLISGYLLAWTEDWRASKGNYSLRAYALRRTRRLLPAYYVALAIGLLLWPGDTTLTQTLIHLAFLQNLVPPPLGALGGAAFDGAYWYLSSEVVFYALLPLLVLKIRGLYQRLALFGVLAAAALAIHIYVDVNVEILPHEYTVYLTLFPLTHLWLFVAGMLLRKLVEHLDNRGPGGSRSTVAFLLFAGPLALLALFPYAPFFADLLASTTNVVDMTANQRAISWMWLAMECLAIPFFAAAVLGSPVLSQVLAWRPLAFVGLVSFSLYLLHNTVAVLIRPWVLSLPGSPLAQSDGAAAWLALGGFSGLVLIVALALSYLSYRYIESPFLRFKPE